MTKKISCKDGKDSIFCAINNLYLLRYQAYVVSGKPLVYDMLELGVVRAGDILVGKGYENEGEVQLLANGHIICDGVEMTIHDWLKMLTDWKSVETYKFAVHKRSGKSLSQIRKEYMDEQDM